ERMAGGAGETRRAEPLRHNALAAELAGVAVDDVAAVLEVLDQPQPDPTAAQQARQRRLAGLDRLAPEGPGLEVEHGAGIREHAFIRPPRPQAPPHPPSP